MKDKYVKLDALERLAKPVEKLKEDEGYDEKEDNDEMGKKRKCACSCCGAPCESCNEAEDDEDSEEESEDKS